MGQRTPKVCPNKAALGRPPLSCMGRREGRKDHTRTHAQPGHCQFTRGQAGVAVRLRPPALGWAVPLSRHQTETGQLLTGRLCHQGETGAGLAPSRQVSGTQGLQGRYEDHVTHSSAAQSGGLLAYADHPPADSDAAPSGAGSSPPYGVSSSFSTRRTSAKSPFSAASMAFCAM